MRTGERAGEVFDDLWRRGEIRIHPTDVEAIAPMAKAHSSGGPLIIADTRDQVAALNNAIRNHHLTTGLTTGLPSDLTCSLTSPDAGGVTTAAGVRLGPS